MRAKSLQPVQQSTAIPSEALSLMRTMHNNVRPPLPLDEQLHRREQQAYLHSVPPVPDLAVAVPRDRPRGTGTQWTGQEPVHRSTPRAGTASRRLCFDDVGRNTFPVPRTDLSDLH